MNWTCNFSDDRHWLVISVAPVYLRRKQNDTCLMREYLHDMDENEHGRQLIQL